MNNIRLKIVSNSAGFTRYRRKFSEFSSYLLSGLLVGAAVAFLGIRTIPLIVGNEQLAFFIAEQRRLVHQEQRSLQRLLYSNTALPDAAPGASAGDGTVVLSDTSAFYRFAVVSKNQTAKVQTLRIQKAVTRKIGFDFSLEVVGSYVELIQFLDLLENSFTYLEIKSMNMSPESAEERYEGLLRLQVNGWFW